MRKILWISMLTAGLGFLAAAGPFLFPAHAQQGWKGEFEDVCGKTDAAMVLGTDELKELIGRCDRLKGKIEAEDESTRKVYLRRLKSCRDLYSYVLETREPK